MTGMPTMPPPIESFAFSASFGLPEPSRETPDEETIAYARGFDDGQATALAQAEQRLAATLERLEQGFDALHCASAEGWNALAHETALLAQVLVERLLRSQPVTATDIEAALLAVAADIRAEASIVIRLAPAAAARLAPTLPAAGADGPRLVLLPDETLAETDFAVEWRDGALRHDRTALFARLDECVRRSFANAPNVEARP